MAYEDGWDLLRLGGEVLPGVWSVEGSCERRLDVKARKGDDGALITDQGAENASIRFVGMIAIDAPKVTPGGTFTLTDARAQVVARVQQVPLSIAAIRQLITRIYPRLSAGGKNERQHRATEVDHPALQLMGIRSVYIRGVGFPTLERGIITLVLSATEWIPQSRPVPKKVRAPPATDIGKLDGGGMTLGDVNRWARGSVYTNDYGVVRRGSGYPPPSESDEAEVNELLTDLAEQVGGAPP
jgi:hypothetical protein